jgi:small-conductance mechanosensitive channel
VKEEILKRLDAIAEKLGVAAQHLWSVLVRQAYIESVAQVVTGILLIVAAVVIVRFVKRSYDREMTRQLNGLYDSHEAIGQFFGFVLCSIAIVAGVSVITFGCLGIANPEYYALKEILETLR